ncbi:DDE-type integrase/transposase/recombinase [Sphingomonas sp. Leaf231]|uniref:DDE-type integrase/transposase/recombinase n=1 Tax=Sphingomonas sp. Leaf231 TaxID=1736301 RepID=UPI00138EF317|nr:DDE-type integrase/transposase/recombinase [Sphingomonas sp. Leaf231]
MVATVAHRCGPVNRRSKPIEWLTDNGSSYTARDTGRFARDNGMIPRTPGQQPQSNGMAEAFVRSFGCDDVRASPTPDARRIIEQLPAWLARYNKAHPQARRAIFHPPGSSREPAKRRQPCRGQQKRM